MRIMKHCKKPMTGCEYRGTEQDYDGVSEYECVVCGKRIGRWSGKVLKDGELEIRYGDNYEYAK